MDIPHKCTVLDYCLLTDDENYKILFCVFCHRVVGYEKNGKRIMKDTNPKEHYKHEYSKETLSDSI